jgi:thymidine kinase
MSKLYFRYGAMCSAKSLNLLAVAHNYRSQDKKVLLIKPNLDTRYGDKIKSRSGLESDVDISVTTLSDLTSREIALSSCDCVLVDEVQFMSSEVIEFLRYLTVKHNVPVICYGLRTDFLSHSFPGSLRLLELADEIEEIKTTCFYCNKKAVFNMRTSDGKPIFTGDQIVLGGNDKYESVCAKCYYRFKEHLSS